MAPYEVSMEHGGAEYGLPQGSDSNPSHAHMLSAAAYNLSRAP